MPPIYLLTGPPGSGKTTLAGHLLARFSHGFHLQVDDLRTWVGPGLSESVPWTEETERQFQVAERAAVRIAQTYQEAGFAVVIDHCRNLPRMDAIAAEMSGVVKILLLPDLETNLRRNRERQNKAFDPTILEETICFVSERYAADLPRDGWIVVRDDLTPEAIAGRLESFGGAERR